jgi:hypothetical protein
MRHETSSIPSIAINEVTISYRIPSNAGGELTTEDATPNKFPIRAAEEAPLCPHVMFRPEGTKEGLRE